MDTIFLLVFLSHKTLINIISANTELQLLVKKHNVMQVQRCFLTFSKYACPVPGSTVHQTATSGAGTTSGTREFETEAHGAQD